MMAVLIILLPVIILLYCGFILYVTFHLNSQAPAPLKPILPHISILVPARNEAHAIAACLSAIQRQDCDMSRVEVIVIDDFSEDGTIRQAEKFLGQMPLKIFKSRLPGKKQALLTGIEAASANIILTTDADCTVGHDWVRLMAGEFQAQDLHMLCGLVRLEGRGLFGRLQQAESAAIVGVSAAMLNLGMPCTCNGASLMFRKDVFTQLGGYAHAHISSGDDDLLMQQFAMADRRKTRYLVLAGSWVQAEACEGIPAVIRQRRRWISKAKAYLFPYNARIQLLVLSQLLAFYSLIVLLFSGYGLFAGILLGFKYLADLLYGRRLRKLIPFNMAAIFLIPFYQLYMLFLPVYALLDKGNWKGHSIHF